MNKKYKKFNLTNTLGDWWLRSASSKYRYDAGQTYGDGTVYYTGSYNNNNVLFACFEI